MKDLLIQELHAIRENMADECGYDFERMLQRQQQVMAEWRSSQLQAQPATRAVPGAAPCAQVAKDGGRYGVDRDRTSADDPAGLHPGVVG